MIARPSNVLAGVWEDERLRDMKDVLYQVRDATSLVSQGLLAPKDVPTFRLPHSPIDDQEQEVADDFYEAMDALRAAMERVEIKRQQKAVQQRELERLAHPPEGPAPELPTPEGTSPWVWVGVGGAALTVFVGAWLMFRRKR